MAFWGFVKHNLGPSLIGGGGVLIAGWGFLGDLQSLWTAGIKPGYLVLSGFVLFVVATVSVVFRQHQIIEQRLGPPMQAFVGVTIEPKEEADATQLQTESQISQSGRIFVPKDVTMDSLMGLYRGHTNLQGEKLTHVYLGKWLRVDGILTNLSSYQDGSYSVFMVRKGKPKNQHDSVPTLIFDPEWGDRLATIPVGGNISVIGKISKIQKYSVWLENCELV